MSNDQQTEITRLRAEVERLNKKLEKYGAWDEAPDECYELAHADLERERDEALKEVERLKSKYESAT